MSDKILGQLLIREGLEIVRYSTATFSNSQIDRQIHQIKENYKNSGYFGQKAILVSIFWRKLGQAVFEADWSRVNQYYKDRKTPPEERQWASLAVKQLHDDSIAQWDAVAVESGRAAADKELGYTVTELHAAMADISGRSSARTIAKGKSTSSHSKKLRSSIQNDPNPRNFDVYGGEPSWQAGHLVPTNNFTKRNKAVQKAILGAQKKVDQYLGANLRDDTINGFMAKAGHGGTHTDKFFTALGEAFKPVRSKKAARKALDDLWKRVEEGEFVKKKK